MKNVEVIIDSYNTMDGFSIWLHLDCFGGNVRL